MCIYIEIKYDNRKCDTRFVTISFICRINEIKKTHFQMQNENIQSKRKEREKESEKGIAQTTYKQLNGEKYYKMKPISIHNMLYCID